MTDECHVSLIYTPSLGWCWRTGSFPEGSDSIPLSADDMRAWATALLKSAAHMDGALTKEDA
jgi:hypothetical protein